MREHVTVHALVTTADRSRELSAETLRASSAVVADSNAVAIDIDDKRRFQTIDGFGAALTGSSAALLRGMKDRGTHVLAELESTEYGAGISYVRVSIGASDFSKSSYTYDDMSPGRSDLELATFSTARDIDVFECLRAMRTTLPSLHIIAAPWTAPAWMKTNQSLNGGHLRAGAFAVYARYLVAYVRSLRRYGLALDAITPQNEPLFATSRYPSMLLSASDEARLIRTELGPRLRAEFPALALIVNDHNWDAAYAATVLSDRRAALYVSGSAFHCYAGDVAAMSDLHRSFPAKGLLVDECTGGGWSPEFAQNLSWTAQHLLIGATTNWARAVLLGNLVLDDGNGPTNGGCADCRGVLTLHRDGSTTRNVEFYVLAHVRAVRPGAVRIASGVIGSDELRQVAFQNRSGSTVLVTFNSGSAPASFAVRYNGRAFTYTLPGGALATFYWPASAKDRA